MTFTYDEVIGGPINPSSACLALGARINYHSHFDARFTPSYFLSNLFLIYSQVLIVLYLFFFFLIFFGISLINRRDSLCALLMIMRIEMGILLVEDAFGIFFFGGLVSVQCGTNVFWRDFCQHRKLGGVILNED